MMNKVKIFWFFIVFFFFSQTAFASEFNHFTALYEKDTQHFKILYPDNAQIFATLLAEYAEDNLKIINEFFATDWQPSSFPIIVTNDKKDLNAFYSSLSSSHIYMYNTIETQGDLSHYDNTIKSVLLHEMGHAFILNNLSSGKKILQDIIGESANNTLYLNMFVVEGLSVALESYMGSGRINDPFVMNRLHTGALKGELLSYRQLSGGISLYPFANSSYLEGGAFFVYLREKYPVEKFHTMISLMRDYISFPALVFSVYGKTLNALIAEFLTSFKPIDYQPSHKFLLENSMYSHLISNNDKLYFYDYNDSEVVCVENDRMQKVLELPNLEKVAISGNDNYLLTISYEDDIPVLRAYEKNGNSLRKRLTVSDVFDAAFVSTPYGYELALYKYDSQNVNKYIQLIDLVSGKEKSTLDLGECSAFSLCECQMNSLGFILKSGTNYELCIWDIHTDVLFSLLNADDNIFKYMSYDLKRNEFVLSYAQKVSYTQNDKSPSLLIYSHVGVNKYHMRKFSLNVEGGITRACVAGDKLYYISSNFNDFSINYINLNELGEFEKREVLLKKKTIDKKSKALPLLQSTDKKKYDAFSSSLPFASSHLLVPSGFFNSWNDFAIGLQNISVEESEQYYSWINLMYRFGRAQKLSFDYRIGLLTKNLTMKFTITPSFKFDDSVEGSVHFDANADFLINYKKKFRSSNNYFNIEFNLGYDLPVFQTMRQERDSLYSSLDILYADTVRKGYGVNSFQGFVTEFYASIADSNNFFKKDNTLIFNPEGKFLFKYYFPFIIPVRNTRLLTYNLPFSLSLGASYKYNMQTKNSSYGVHNLDVGLSLSMVLFAMRLCETEIDFPFMLDTFVVQFVANADYVDFMYEFIKYNGLLFNFRINAYVGAVPSVFGEYITTNNVKIGVRLDLTQIEPGSAFYFAPSLIFNITNSNL